MVSRSQGELGESRGIALLVAAAFSFSVMSVCVKLAGEELPVSMLVLARGVVTLFLSYVTLKLKGVSPWGNDRPRLVLRGVFGTAGLACFFYAVTALPLAEVTVIHYLNPIVTAVVAGIFLREVIDGRLVFAIIASLLGTVFVVRPEFVFGRASPLDPIGVVAALAGAFAAALAYTTVRHLRHSDDPHVIVFYFPLVAVPATLPFAVVAWHWPSLRGWFLLLALGVATQLAQVLFTQGLRLVPAGRGTTVGYVQILFASFWAWLIWGHMLSWLALLGAGLIVVGTLSLLRSRKAVTTRG